MSITLEEVKHVARLARLELSEKELVEFQGELNALLLHFNDIQQVDVTGLAPKPHAVNMVNVYADDIPQPGLSRDDALRNASKTRAGLFIVPAIIEDQS